MPIYTCEKCQQEFKQKSDYTRHIQKKYPCITQTELSSKIEKVKETIKTKVLEKKEDIEIDDLENDLAELTKSTDKKRNKIKIVDDKEQIDNTTKSSKGKKSGSGKNTKKTKVESEIDYSFLRLPENKVIFELKENDNKIKTDSKNKIVSMIDKAHDTLYTEENIEGEDALNDIMNWMFIKCIQPIISDEKEDGKIDLLNKEHYEGEDEKILSQTFSYFKDLKKLANQPLEAIRNLDATNDIIRQMGEILKTHPDTKMIFTENNFIKARKATTIQLLLNNVINKINIEEIEQNEDVIGEIYEHIINGYVKKGSKLGQFFTPRKLMKLLLQYKTKRMNEIINSLDKDGSILIGDTCMGTGGWIVSAYNILKAKFKDRLLLTGGEVKPTTFQYGLMNLILTLKEFPHDVHCESSLTHINTIKNHFLFTNPPFQTDKKFDQVTQNFTADTYTKKNKIKLSDVYTLQDNNPPIQFLELDYYKLEDSGMCMIILPYGELFFGSSYKNAREHFMENCNITDIVLFHGGIFTHTGIKTCALIFEKDAEGTKEINFIQANKECSKLTKITSIKMEDINKEPNKSWYLRDYLKDEYIEGLVSEMTNYEWVEFGKVFTLEKGKIQSSKVEENESGKYPVISKAQNSDEWKYTNEYKLDGKNVFIFLTCNTTKLGITYYDGKCLTTDLVSCLVTNVNYTKKINKLYIYHYLKFIKNHIELNYLRGSCHQSLDINAINRMKIPIPTLEEQEKIMESTKFYESDTFNTKSLKINNELKRKFYMECMIKGATRRKLNVVKRLGEIIKFLPNGKRKSSEGDEKGKYPLYYCSINNVLYIDEYDFDGEAITINVTNGSGKCGIFHPKGKYSVAESTLHFCSKDENIISTNVLFNYLNLIKNNISNIYKGTQQMSIHKDDLERKIIVPIPPLDRQKQMQKAFDNFDWFDEVYTNRINENEEQIKTAFYESLDTYGNPNAVNIEKMFFGNSENTKNTNTKIISETETNSETEAETSSITTKKKKSIVKVI